MSGGTTPINTGNGESTGGLLSDMRPSGGTPAPLADAAPPTAPRRKINPQTLVLALVLSASGAALFMMRKQGMRGGLNFNHTSSVENQVEKVRGKSSVEEQRILSDLARSTALAAVPPEKIQKNPFVLVEEATPSDGRGPDPNALRAEQDRRAREQREQDIQSRFSSLRCTSVMEGPTPVAYVNNKLVKVGDVIEDYFTVAQIYDRSVELLADGRPYSLEVSKTTGGPPGAPGGAPRPPHNFNNPPVPR
jgi:hypothetical protein